VAEAFLPRSVEDAQIQRYRQLNAQIADYSRQANAAARGQALVKLYADRPWLSPGIATAYTKWQEQFGTKAAQGLARAAATAGTTPADPSAASGPASFAAPHTNEALLDFVATKDFQAQVSRLRNKRLKRQMEDKLSHESFAEAAFGDPTNLVDYLPVAGVVKGAIEGKDLGELALRAVPGAKAGADLSSGGFAAASEIPGVGPTIKGVSRTAFTALESPYQELQAQASDVLGHVVGGFENAARGQGSPTPSGNSFTSGAHDNSSLTLGGGQALGSSTGGIALEHLLSGENVDLGTGFFPGGAVAKEHTQRVRDIASFHYNGETHFATPGRIFASIVTEPGTDPYNVASGLIDGFAIVKGDPTNIALTKYSEIAKARKGFAPTTIEEVGGFRGAIRAFVDGPTASRYLDNPRKGGVVLGELANGYAGRPDRLAELMVRTKFKWGADLYDGIVNTATGDRDGIRAILEPALGTTIDRQPQLNTFAANIRNATARHPIFTELPGRNLSLAREALGGHNGSLHQLYNWMVSAGVERPDISNRLSEIVSAQGKVARGEGVFHMLNATTDAVVARGVPREKAEAWISSAFGDIHDIRTYNDAQIASGAYTPAHIVGGAVYPTDKPFLLSEHLGDRIILPSLTGRNGLGQTLARYGRLFDIGGTGVGDAVGRELLDPLGNVVELEPETRAFVKALHAPGQALYAGNTAAIHVQNSLWKPMALIRFAWTARVLGEEQVRMAFAGYSSLIHHPLTYIAIGIAKKEDKNAGLLDFAAEQKAMRGSMEGAFGLPDSTFRRMVGQGSHTYVPTDTAYHANWADLLARYSEDDVTHAMAQEMSAPDVTDDLIDRMRVRFWDGDLADARADLAHSRPLQDAGIDMNTQEGVDRYIRETEDRLHFYTQGDSELIGTIANKEYRPTVTSVGKGRSLNGREVVYDGEVGEIVSHRKGSEQAEVLFPDGTSHGFHLNMLEFPDSGETTRLLTRNETGVKVDEEFVNHLHSKTTVPDRVSGTVGEMTTEKAKLYDRAVQMAFSYLMDIPATKLNRSHVFLEAYYNELERLLPHMDEAARAQHLAEAHTALLQDAHGVKGRIAAWALSDKYKALEKAAAKPTVGTLSYEEAETIAKGHSLDNLRELLYDTHKRNKGLAAAQLVAPFGEAWKEMIGSWGRIIKENPQTIRKVQIGVTAAQGANPFSLLPGAVPDYYSDKGFIIKDPKAGGANMFIYPWSLPFNEALTGVPVAQTGDPMSLSMGFNLLPGVGPVFQMTAGTLLDRYLTDPKWDPLKHVIMPYGATDYSEGIGAALEDAFAPAWFLKFARGAATNPKGDTQDAKAMNGIMSEILASGAADGTYNMTTEEGIRLASRDAESKARELYWLQSSFQFGAPAAPRFEFFAEDKNKKLVPTVLMRDEFFKLATNKNPEVRAEAVPIFIARYGKRAMFTTAPKTLGTAFGQQYTQEAYDWERTNPDLVEKYPMSFPEFAPRAKSTDQELSWAAWLHAVSTGKRQAVKADDAVHRVNNVLGSWEYDEARRKMGLSRDDVGSRAQQADLRAVRDDIHSRRPGWRELAVDRSRIPRIIEELTRASSDVTLYKSNPRLALSLASYVDARQDAIDQVAAQGGTGDFLRPGYATARRFAGIRESLRLTAEDIGKSDPQFLTLWQDTFAREMKEDD
jgi:hypothetical protein